MSIAILKETTENFLWFERFKQGDEKALEYIHRHTCKLLNYYACKIVDDNFVVSSLMQETYIKAWNMRATMENMGHLFFFMKLSLSWACLSWLKNPRNVFNRQKIYYTDKIESYETSQSPSLYDTEELSHFFDEERLEIIEKVIPYLTPARQTMMDLYFKQGLSYKAIARRFGATHMAVHAEVQRSLDHLKTIIQRKKKQASVPKLPVAIVPAGTNTLDTEMTHIYRLRLEHKMGFATIAEKMNLEQGYVQRKYIEAHALLAKMGMAV